MIPDAPYTVAQCEGALRAAEALAVGSNTVAKRKFWENIQLAWAQRLEEAKVREGVYEQS